MRIRSITYFFDPARLSPKTALHSIDIHRDALQENLSSAGYAVQSVRLATTPFPRWLDVQNEQKVCENIRDLCSLVQGASFDYLSLGP